MLVLGAGAGAGAGDGIDNWAGLVICMVISDRLE